MKKFLTDLFTFVHFVAAIPCFYLGATVAFSTALVNLLLFFSAVFFLIQAAGFIDRAKGFGKYSEQNNSPNESNQVKNNSDTDGNN